MTCPTTFLSTPSIPVQLDPAGVPSPPPAASVGDRAQVQPGLDLWVNLLADLIVDEVCRQLRTAADPVVISAENQAIGGAA